jgi:hypothetical protein
LFAIKREHQKLKVEWDQLDKQGSKIMLKTGRVTQVIECLLFLSSNSSVTKKKKRKKMLSGFHYAIASMHKCTRPVHF